MPAAPICGIIFDNKYNTYFAGQTVTGRVELVLHKPKKLKGVLLKIQGGAQVAWTVQQKTSKGRTDNVTYTAAEEYFKMEYYCAGGAEHDTITLPPGTHSYPFSYVLPPSLPSSFEGAFGSIRYISKVILERPWKRNHETKVAFTVVSQYDLNLHPNLHMPAKVFAEKYFCYFCCKSGPLSVVMMVPKTGYVSGERIPIVIEVDNNSNVEVPSVNLNFQQLTTFYSHHPGKDKRQQTIVFEKMKLGGVKAKNSKTWTQTLLIPPVPPSNLGNCSIIEPEYQLYLEVSGNKFHVNLKSSTPITIGTVPIIGEAALAGTQGQIPAPRPHELPPDYETAMASGPIPSSRASWISNVSPSAPIQTFGENHHFNVKSIQDAEDASDAIVDSTSKGYTPFYPTYKFNYDGP